MNEVFGTYANLRYFLNLFMVGANVYCKIVIWYCVDTIYKHELIYYHREKKIIILKVCIMYKSLMKREFV